MIEPCHLSPFPPHQGEGERYARRLLYADMCHCPVTVRAAGTVSGRLRYCMQQGYQGESIRRYLGGCRQCDQWLTQHGQTMAEVSADTLHQYLHSLRRSPAGKLPPTAHGVQHLLAFLQRQGVIASSTAPRPSTDTEQWVQRYAHMSGARTRCGAQHTPELSPLRTALRDRAFWCQPDRLARRRCPGLRRLVRQGGGDETRGGPESPCGRHPGAFIQNTCKNRSQ